MNPEGLRADLANAMRTLGAGLRLAILGRPSLTGLRLDAELFWFLAAIGMALSAVLAWLAAEPPRLFDSGAVAQAGLGIAITLFLSTLAARLLHRPDLLWSVAVLSLAASLPVDIVASLVGDHLESVDDLEPASQWAIYALLLLWWLAIVGRILGLLAPEALHWRRFAAAATWVIVGLAAAFTLPRTRFWETDYYAAYEEDEGAQAEPLIAEALFARQPTLVSQATSQVAPSAPDAPHLYFVAFAPYGSQDVFLREARFAQRLFEERFGAQGRTVILANSREPSLPLATATNLRQALRDIGQRMDPAKDVLFLFLTSHGSRDAELSVELEDLSFVPFTAAALRSMLDDAGIRWRVLLVSGCYSGSFIPALKDERTLLMTAAAADRNSFGCSDGNDFTWFGRAYFEKALAEHDSFADAFGAASEHVAKWEKEKKYEPSNPQIVTGPLIESHLQRWRTSLPASATAAR